jgi:ribonuclease HI
MNYTFVYTDGACSNNNNPILAKAGYGIYFGENDDRNVSEKIIGKATNNIAELTAIIEAIKITKNIPNPVIIATDSKYAILCGTSYGKKLDKNNWISNKPIKNLELVKELYYLLSEHTNIQLQHITAHTNNTDIHSIGNAEADRLAKNAIGNDNCEYTDNNIYIIVPFERKEEAKKLKARWNPNAKKWYTVPSNKNNEELFKLFPKFIS